MVGIEVKPVVRSPAWFVRGLAGDAFRLEPPLPPHQAEIDAASPVVLDLPLQQIDRAALDSPAGDAAIHLDMDLRPGGMPPCSNHAVLHSRTELDDLPQPERLRPLAEGLPPQSGHGGLAETALAGMAAA